MMKHGFNNLRELAPVALLSVLLFVSCSQLPVIDNAEVAETVVQQETVMPPAEDATQQAAQEEQEEQIAAVIMPAPAESQEQVSQNTQPTALPAAGDQAFVLAPGVPESPEQNAVLADDPAEDIADTGSAEPAAAETAIAENGTEAAVTRTLAEVEILLEEWLLHQQNVTALCEEIGSILGSITVEDCLAQELQFAGAYSVNDRPLAQRDFSPRNQSQDGPRILIMGGIHGDEYSSISIMFKWMSLLQQTGGNSYTWRFLPAVNPDGLLGGQAERQNASGVDLNRNFPSQDWEEMALEYWRNNTGENPRRYPGETAASEPEVRWIIEQIESFNPEVIVSVHAPYHLLDFDGPADAPEKIGDLYLHQLGVYPGSLGNYAGLDLGIPVITLELPSAGIMPTNEQIETMWIDMLAWLNTQVIHEQSAAR